MPETLLYPPNSGVSFLLPSLTESLLPAWILPVWGAATGVALNVLGSFLTAVLVSDTGEAGNTGDVQDARQWCIRWLHETLPNFQTFTGAPLPLADMGHRLSAGTECSHHPDAKCLIRWFIIVSLACDSPNAEHFAEHTPGYQIATPMRGDLNDLKQAEDSVGWSRVWERDMSVAH